MGTTSACAENTAHPVFPAPPARNYLRVRGEYDHRTPPIRRAMELPPRTRRIRVGFDHALGLGGTTSAYAENTLYLFLVIWNKGNYLRVRGEYLRSGGERDAGWELPPRTRRIPPGAVCRHDSGGTTSAYAENTAAIENVFYSDENYLRVRGEYASSAFSINTEGELPPRTRRILYGTGKTVPTCGTTSAYAENTLNELGIL